ncbi:Septum formation [Nocardioides sp. YR527]|uniref:DUF4190 domain-containing protein n=1 Tax=Nocardioides sp. YR527 TaxID=1881028 RepID=UPI00088FB234|nr:DUF4190 domain-containing protein [Nocardioides sp. YR527]SDK81889.1 Septum formation [Nocardioides sp. YR527]
MAIAALILCCFIFFPLAPIVGIGLAIAVLVRSRRGRNHGTKKAITGIAIGTSGLALVVGLVTSAWWFTTGANIERDSIGAVTSNGTGLVADLQVGDCYNDPKPGSVKHTIGIVDVVPCAQEHRWEIYQLAPIPGTSWPGYGEVEDRTYESCRAAFIRLTADSNDGLSLSTYSFAPTEYEWNAGDHYATCIAGNVFPSTGSISD